MSQKLEDIKGLGKKADALKEAGIDSVDKLANSKVEDLIELKGIGKSTAEKIIENAKELLDQKPKEGETEDIKKEEGNRRRMRS